MFSVISNQRDRYLAEKVVGQLGLSIFPCRIDQKKPALVGWQEAATNDPANTAEWFDLSRYNYGILCGTERGGRYLTMIDVDCKKNKHGPESWAELTVGIGAEQLNTFTVQTPSGGRHYYFYANHPFGNPTDVLDGIDIRGKGGYAVGPGSSIDGKDYVIANDAPILDMPFDLEERLRKDLESPGPNQVQEKPLAVLSDRARGNLLDLLGEYAARGGFVSYGEWIRLGGALKHEGFAVQNWQALSHADARDQCLVKWNVVPSSRLTIGSLIFWARKVQPDFSLNDHQAQEQESSPRSVATTDGDTAMQARAFHSINECMEFFDTRFFKVIFGNKVVVVERDADLTDNLGKKDFYDAHSNKGIILVNPHGSQEIPAAKYWFEHTSENYRRVVFNPSPDYQPKKDEINLWKGFAVQAEDNGKAQSYLDFVREVACDEDDDVYNYLLDVMARIVQEPHRKIGANISVALRGRQGVGKSFFVENFGRLFGESYVMIDSVQSIIGHFNGFLLNKILVFGDEAVWGGDRANKNILKSLISSSTVNIERKFKDAFTATNYCRFFFATNADWAAPVERSNRRYLVLDLSDTHIKDKDYFAQIKKDLESGGYSDLLHFLLHRDYSQRDFERTLPVTPGSVDNLLNGLTPMEEWLFNMLAYETRLSLTFEEIWGKPVRSSFLYDRYAEFVKNKGAFLENRGSFGAKLKHMFSSLKKERIQEDGCRGWHYLFPDLEAARNEFCEYLGFEIDWEEV